MARTPLSSFLEKLSKAHTVALVANGAVHDCALIAQLISTYDLCIAVDGGLIHCDHMQIRPDLIVGDLDSAPAELLAKYHDIPINVFATDKN